MIAAVMCAGGSLFADTIGYVDMESIFANAKMVKHFQENMKEKQADYQEFFEKKQKSWKQMKNFPSEIFEIFDRSMKNPKI